MANQTPELPDNQLIHNGIEQNPYPFWFWLFIFAIGLSLLWGVQSWYLAKFHQRYELQPFFQVTNREMSVFLWQNPKYMRAHAAQKSDYLSGFQYLDKVSVEVQAAEQFAQAPPELLFRYHTWYRQIRLEFPKREMTPKEFQEFLNYAEEWQPQHWPEAPQEYVALVNSLDHSTENDLQTLPNSTLPLSVRLAFQGWKNYFKEGEAINAVQAKRETMERFLHEFPHYARPYWRNIEGENYLKVLMSPSTLPQEEIPSSELSPSLKAAYYNFSQIQNSKS